jgi:hypothetical protein
VNIGSDPRVRASRMQPFGRSFSRQASDGGSPETGPLNEHDHPIARTDDGLRHRLQQALEGLLELRQTIGLQPLAQRVHVDARARGC